MPTISTYALTTVFFVASYFFNWHALLSTDWLVLHGPFNKRISYGLFQMCIDFLIKECTPFPSTDGNDCEEDYFCEKWILSSSFMAVASAIGGLTLFYLVTILLFNSSYTREKSWNKISALIFLAGLSQLATMFLITNLLYNSNKFYGFKYGIGFSYAMVSAFSNILIGIVLMMNGILSPPEYAYY